MPDITSLLGSTTPVGLPRPDVADLARRGRRRRRRQRARIRAAALGVVLVAVIVALGSVGVLDLDVPGDPRPGNGVEVATPVGHWQPAATPPFEPRAEATGAQLSDGRVLVWGGVGPLVNDTDRRQFDDGGVYDPAADTWELIPAPPDRYVGDWQLAGDRLAVLTLGTFEAPPRAWIYDIAVRRWTPSPVLPTGNDVDGDLLWDGETVAVVHLQGLDSPDPPSSTLRWRLGEPDWLTGEPSPLSARMGPGRAFDGSRFAVWGGTSSQLDNSSPIEARDPGLLADGAIYDLADDTWAALPASPLSAGRFNVPLMWWQGKLVVGGGEVSVYSPNEGPPTGEVDALVAFDPTTNLWESLPPAPEAADVDAPSRASVYGPVGDPLRAAVDLVRSTGNWILLDTGWEQAPFDDAQMLGDVVVATSRGQDVASDVGFEAQVRVGVNSWRPLVAAPFADRTDAAIVPMGDRLLVSGGAEGDDGQRLADDAWVVDLGSHPENVTPPP